MGLISSGSEVSDATLNSLMGFDAIVSPGGGSGRYYTTVAAALSAGHKAIAVQPGTYAAGFTVSSPGAKIIGLSAWSGVTGGPTGGPVFEGQISINANYCEVYGLGVNSATRGIDIGAGYGFNLIRRCAVAEILGDSGIILHQGNGNQVVDCVISNCAEDGIIIYPNAAAGDVDGAVLRGNWIYQCARMGIYLAEYQSTDTATYRQTLVDGNTVRQCCTSSGAGIFVKANHSGRLIGNLVENCGDGDTDASGIYLEAPDAAPKQGSIVAANVLRGNTGYGFELSGASVTVGGTGNIFADNGLGPTKNASACPGFDNFSTADTNIYL